MVWHYQNLIIALANRTLTPYRLHGNTHYQQPNQQYLFPNTLVLNKWWLIIVILLLVLYSMLLNVGAKRMTALGSWMLQFLCVVV